MQISPLKPATKIVTDGCAKEGKAMKWNLGVVLSWLTAPQLCLPLASHQAFLLSSFNWENKRRLCASLGESNGKDSIIVSYYSISSYMLFLVTQTCCFYLRLKDERVQGLRLYP